MMDMPENNPKDLKYYGRILMINKDAAVLGVGLWNLHTLVYDTLQDFKADEGKEVLEDLLDEVQQAMDRVQQVYNISRREYDTLQVAAKPKG